MEGRGCQKDVVRAKNYFIKASNGGDAFGCANMGLLEVIMGRKQEHTLHRQLQQQQRPGMDHWMGGDPVRQLQQDRIDKKVREMVVNKTPGWVKACTDQQRRQEKERDKGAQPHTTL